MSCVVKVGRQNEASKQLRYVCMCNSQRCNFFTDRIKSQPPLPTWHLSIQRASRLFGRCIYIGDHILLLASGGSGNYQLGRGADEEYLSYVREAY